MNHSCRPRSSSSSFLLFATLKHIESACYFIEHRERDLRTVRHAPLVTDIESFLPQGDINRSGTNTCSVCTTNFLSASATDEVCLEYTSSYSTVFLGRANHRSKPASTSSSIVLNQVRPSAPLHPARSRRLHTRIVKRLERKPLEFSLSTFSSLRRCELPHGSNVDDGHASSHTKSCFLVPQHFVSSRFDF